MRETTIVMKKHITIEAVKRVVEIEKQISEAVQLFGYNLVNTLILFTMHFENG